MTYGGLGPQLGVIGSVSQYLQKMILSLRLFALTVKYASEGLFTGKIAIDI